MTTEGGRRSWEGHGWTKEGRKRDERGTRDGRRWDGVGADEEPALGGLCLRAGLLPHTLSLSPLLFSLHSFAPFRLLYSTLLFRHTIPNPVVVVVFIAIGFTVLLLHLVCLVDFPYRFFSVVEPHATNLLIRDSPIPSQVTAAEAGGRRVSV